MGGPVHYRPQWLGGVGGPHRVGGPVHYRPQWLGEGGGGGPHTVGGTCSLQTAVVRGGWVGPTRWWWAPHGVGTCSLQTAVVRGEGVGPHKVGGPVHYRPQWLGEGEGVGPTRWWAPHGGGDLFTTNRSGYGG